MPEKKQKHGLTEILNVLNQHQDKNFVQRINMPKGYPTLYDSFQSFIYGPSTHSMAWGTDENSNAYVYPTVIQPGADQPLVRLNAQQAWDYAKTTGERIPFEGDHEFADWFSQEYKQVWKK